MPTQLLVLGQVTCDTGFEIPLCAACVDVVTSRKRVFTKAANGDGDGSGELDVELVGLQLWHYSSA